MHEDCRSGFFHLKFQNESEKAPKVVYHHPHLPQCLKITKNITALKILLFLFMKRLGCGDSESN